MEVAKWTEQGKGGRLEGEILGEWGNVVVEGERKGGMN